VTLGGYGHTEKIDELKFGRRKQVGLIYNKNNIEHDYGHDSNKGTIATTAGTNTWTIMLTANTRNRMSRMKIEMVMAIDDGNDKDDSSFGGIVATLTQIHNMKY